MSQLCVRDEERTATILAVSRKCAYIQSMPQFSRRQILMSSLARYYALSAASAVFKYVEIKLKTQFASASLRIRFAPVEGTMMIDPETVRNLEIVDNMGNARSPHSLFGYGMVSRCIIHIFIFLSSQCPQSLLHRHGQKTSTCDFASTRYRHASTPI